MNGGALDGRRASLKAGAGFPRRTVLVGGSILPCAPKGMVISPRTANDGGIQLNNGGGRSTALLCAGTNASISLVPGEGAADITLSTVVS